MHRIDQYLEKPIEETKVIVGMSGGVDSSVSALLLKQQGFQVEGLFMKNWEEDDNDEYCAAADDLADAQSVADKLGIYLHKINFAAEYWDRVFEYFLQEYKAGRTPNPDIMCNKEIKFKAFLEFAAEDLGADYIATGHYCRRRYSNDGWQLIRGLDENKDQSYFLYALNEEQISKTLFPVGNIPKPEVRELAKQHSLITHDKKDSTGICFIGERKFRDFLSQYLPAKPGIIETTEGEEIGTHQGLMYHTLGQRKGLFIGGKRDHGEDPWYVVEKDVAHNKLIVGQGSNHPALFSHGLVANQVHFINESLASTPRRLTVKTRYRQQDIECTFTPTATNTATIMFTSPQKAVTPGQSAVFYDNEVCLGGGIIDSYIKDPKIQENKLKQASYE